MSKHGNAAPLKLFAKEFARRMDEHIQELKERLTLIMERVRQIQEAQSRGKVN